jgi:hypothetical protein
VAGSKLFETLQVVWQPINEFVLIADGSILSNSSNDIDVHK